MKEKFEITKREKEKQCKILYLQILLMLVDLKFEVQDESSLDKRNTSLCREFRALSEYALT